MTPAGEKLGQLRQRIEQWRRTRRQHGPMPRELWEEATELGRSLGVSQVSRALGVGYASLQQRMRGGQEARQEAPETSAPGGLGAFIELERPRQTGARPGGEVLVELVAADGGRMTLRWQAPSALEVAGLVAALRGGRG